MAPDNGTTPSASVILRDVSEEICTLTLNRPENRNPLSDEVLEALQKALDEIAQDAAIKAVILAENG